MSDIDSPQDMSNAALDGLRNNINSPVNSLKRQVGYDQTESEMSSRLKRLRMDTEEEMDQEL